MDSFSGILKTNGTETDTGGSLKLYIYLGSLLSYVNIIKNVFCFRSTQH